MENKRIKETVLFRAEVYYANLPEKKDSHIQGGYRPIVIWSNDKNNMNSPTYNYYALSATCKSMHLPVHVLIAPDFLPKNTIVLCEHPKTDDEVDLLSYIDWNKGCIGILSEDEMYKIFVGAAIQSGCGRYVHYFRSNQLCMTV